MIRNFEDYTNELNHEELRLVPLVINGFKKYNIESPIKSAEVVSKLNKYLAENDWKIKMSGVRLRKIVNHIRSNSLLPLMASSKGYYVSNDAEHIKEQIVSLEQRASSIQRCADGLRKYLK